MSSPMPRIVAHPSKAKTTTSNAGRNNVFFFILPPGRNEEHTQPSCDPNAMLDPYSLSNTLRSVGEFLDRKPDIKLLFASNRGQEVVILYETKGGVRHLEEYPISTIYEFWVKEYVKRKK
jgi:hypothetical protein